MSLVICLEYVSHLLFFLLYRVNNFPSSSTWLTLNHRFGGERVKVQLGHLKCVLKIMSSCNTYWAICLNDLDMDLKIVNNILFDMAKLQHISLCLSQYTYMTTVGS